MGKRTRHACQEPGCQWEGELIEGHMRAAHTGEQLSCGFPGCEFRSAWPASIHNHRQRLRHKAPSVLPPLGGEPRPSADENAELAPGEAPSAEEGVDTELLGESDLAAELNAAKEEAALAQHMLKKYKSALREEKERTASLRAELAAAEVATAEAEQGKALAIAEVEAMAGAHARELREAHVVAVASRPSPSPRRLRAPCPPRPRRSRSLTRHWRTPPVGSKSRETPFRPASCTPLPCCRQGAQPAAAWRTEREHTQAMGEWIGSRQSCYRARATSAYYCGASTVRWAVDLRS
jgi:hypothetical protein